MTAIEMEIFNARESESLERAPWGTIRVVRSGEVKGFEGSVCNRIIPLLLEKWVGPALF